MVSLKPEDIHPEKRWLHHGSPWNLNCATGWYKALVEGIVGIESDIGGLTYVPCNLSFPIELRGLRFRQTLWDITISGQGNEIDKIIADGKPVVGTYKLPRRCYRAGKHTLEVHYGTKQRQNFFLRELRGGEVTAVEAGKKSLAITMKGFGTVTLVFTAPTQPRLLFENRQTDFLWNEETLAGEVDIFAPGEHTLQILCT